MLHLVFAGQSGSDLLTRCLAALAPGDAMLILSAEIAELVAQPGFAKELEAKAAKGCQLMILDEDIEKTQSSLPPCVRVVGYEEFVQLVAEHEQSRSWF